LQDLGLGKYCCPSASNETQSVCCNVDPNPPTTPYPMPASALGSAARPGSVASIVVAALFLVHRQVAIS
jgi:hypothetical protein